MDVQYECALYSGELGSDGDLKVLIFLIVF